MTVTTRTNLVTNPRCGTAATGYTAVPGTGGTATGARATATPYEGAGFYRVSWTAATTAVSGGASYLQTGLAAGAQYAYAIVLRCNKTQNVTLGIQYQDSTSTNVGSQFLSAGVNLVANVWSNPVTIQNSYLSGTGVDRAVITAIATSGFGVNWANGDTLDVGLLFMETGPIIGTPFDGGTANTTGLPTNKTYAWTGAADASTSTETTRTVTMSATQISQSNGCPGAQITIQDAGPAVTYKTSLTRLCEAVLNTVPGATTVNLTDAAVVNDYAVPLARTVTYALLYNGSTVASATITVTSATAWVQDPLQPDKGIPIKLDGNNPGYLTMDAQSLQEVTYQQPSNRAAVLGSAFPTVLGGQPQEASGLTIVLYSDDKSTADAFRAMKKGTPILLFRPLTGMDPLPALAYISPAVKEKPVNFVYGGTQDSWYVTGDIVAAIRQAITSGYVTYQNVQDLITTGNTYAMVQTKSAAKTYLNWQQNPRIWSTL